MRRLKTYVLCVMAGLSWSTAGRAELPLLVRDDLEQGMARWQTTDPEAASSVWKIESLRQGTEINRVLRVTGPSDYEPPFRSPHSIALLKDATVGDFELSVRLQNTNPGAGAHRDLCLFWGYQDPSHFYYVHLGAEPDPHSCQIFVVDEAPRLKITRQESSGTRWTSDWHRVKIVRRVADGAMEVYFDDMTQPCMTARDSRFGWGRVGLGTFDDSGNFDEVQLHGALVSPPANRRLPVAVRESAEGAVVEADGRPFAAYLKRTGHQPAIWPLIGPGGFPVTRAFPIADREAATNNDHPHHVSVWFTHGSVNGFDFWLEPSDDHPQTLIQHRKFEKLAADEHDAVIATRNDWTADGRAVLEDVRTWRFAATSERRWIDATIELIAAAGDVTFGDTKEGSFGVRVPGPMNVDAGLGGAIRNDRGQRDADAWGQPARWVDYSGPAGPGNAGIALMSHPQSFRPECRWHVRTYGLFAANPFGKSDFPPGEPSQGAVSLKQGESLVLRYRIYLHDGSASDEELQRAFAAFAATH